MKKKQKKLVRKSNRANKKVLILGIVCLILLVGLIFALVWNFNLKNDIRELNENINILSVSAVNDFSLFVMRKVDKCEPVTLMADDKSITINNVNCR
ncbi:MAG: hypothetical protein ABFQ65_04185 [Nanoarchaeota archaeon]